MTEQNLTADTGDVDDAEGHMHKADEIADDTEGHGRYWPADDTDGSPVISDNEDDVEGHKRTPRGDEDDDTEGHARHA